MNTNSRAATTAITTSPQTLDGFRSLLQRAQPGLAAVAARHLPPERLLRLALSAASRMPDLLLCSSQSLLVGLMHCATLGMEPNTPMGHCYLLPFRNSRTGTHEATFVLGYKGAVALAWRSGEVQSLDAAVVRKQDKFLWKRGLNAVLEHEPDLLASQDDRENPIIAAYGIVTMKSGGKLVEVMSREEVENVRARSRSGQSGPWVTDYARMACKTVLKSALRLAPMSAEFEQAVLADDTGASAEALSDEAMGALHGVLDTPRQPASNADRTRQAMRAAPPQSRERQQGASNAGDPDEGDDLPGEGG